VIGLPDIQGHWVRDWIKAPGFEDHTTRVHWVQAGNHYADVRIPLDRPDIGGAGAMSDLSARDLGAMAKAEGFAGHVALKGTQVTWHREINWHGTPEAPDVGDISFDAQGRMIEAGVLADYTELWERAPGDTSALRFSGHGYSGVVAMVGDRAVVGIGQRDKPATKPLTEALAEDRVPSGIEALFDGLHALCTVAGGALTADLATQPFSEGTPVLSLQGATAVWHRMGFDSTRDDLEMVIEP